MSTRVLSFCSLAVVSSAVAPGTSIAQVPPPAVQVEAALLAAPGGHRDEARVLGYDASGTLVPLRAGGNALVCLADDPADPGFSVACYHESLEPYMARGRALAAQGTTDGTERNRVRWREAEEGKLTMPRDPATLYVLTGSAYDPEAGTVTDPYLRFVIYVPGATAESTGLSVQPTGPGSPWLMFPGTPGAHIMISPPPPPGG